MIVLSSVTVASILRWASRHPTVEVCGMVWQFPDGGQNVHPLRNVSAQPDRYYSIDPGNLIDGYTLMDNAGASLLGFYHSHPGGKPDPSEADMEGALNVGVHYLIAYPLADPQRYPEPIWRLSAWECIEQGILVADEYRCG